MCSIHASLPHDDDDDDDDNNNNSDDDTTMTMSVKIKPEAHFWDNWKLKENKTRHDMNRNETKNETREKRKEKEKHKESASIIFCHFI